jgi:GT2 family glycosyltransferase/glycosyltransferase involved in cell wall biosynthesis
LLTSPMSANSRASFLSGGGMTRPEVTLIVVTHNSRAHIDDLVESIPGGMAGIERWRLIVVDNASHDGTSDAVRQLWPGAHLIEQDQNLGYAAGINAGLRACAPQECVVVLNPDARLHEECVMLLVNALQAKEVGIAVPRLCTRDGATSLSLRREPSIRSVWAEAVLGGRRAARLGISEVIADRNTYVSGQDVDWATGAVMAISAACRDAVGNWDESFFLYSEEVDYCRRAREAGFVIRYVPSAVSEHVGGKYGTNVALWRTLVRNRARYYRRHHSSAKSALFQAGLAFNQLLRAPSSPAHRASVGVALRPRDPGPVGTGRTIEHRQGFVWFAAQDWWYHNQAHSDFQLMRRVARWQPVLVVNTLGLRMPRKGISTNPTRRILRKLRSTAKFLRRPLPDNPGYHVMTPVLLPFYGDTAGARLNAWLIRQQVGAAAKAIGIGSKPAIGVTIPSAWPVVRKMRRSALLYNRSDLQSAFPEADRAWVVSLEDKLLEASDRVLYVSHELMRMDYYKVGDRGYFLDHGVDLEHFSLEGESEISDELAIIPTPRVGFFGGLDDYVVDMDLLRLTAVELPEIQVVLIGDATCGMDELTGLPNVHWLGYRPYQTIPSLGRGFDVALMPWLDNEWIRFANPIKLKEYLALGLPVVTTAYPEVDAYRSRLWVARSREEFPALVKEALANPGDPMRRRASVFDCSWEARAKALTEIANAVRGP